MNILWCEEHDEHAATKAGGDQWCWRANFTPSLKPCRMVPMRLIPDNAETCGSFGCTLAKGHNMGKADIPENHALDGETP